LILQTDRGLCFLNDAAAFATLLTPLAALLGEALDAADTACPEAFDRGSEGESTLRANYTDSLQNSLAAVAPKYGRVVDPLKTALELVVKSRNGVGVDARTQAEPVV
jgi:hypothetical protein